MINAMNAPGYYDWSGSAAMLEDLATGSTFEELAGLDPLLWAVVAIELAAGSTPQARTGLVLYAVDLRAFALSSLADRREILANVSRAGAVSVRRIVREDLGIQDVLAQMKTAHVEFRSYGFDDVELTCTATPEST